MKSTITRVAKDLGEDEDWLRELAIEMQYMTTSEQLGRAMMKVARDGCPKQVLKSEDINAI